MPPSAQSVAEMRTDIGFSRGPGLSHLVEQAKRKAQAILERTSVLVGADVRQWRKEAGKQVAVGAMQLQHVEAGAVAADGRLDELSDDLVHVARRSLARHLAFGIVGQGRGRADVPRAVLKRAVHSLPHQPCRALAAGMADLQAEFRLRIRVNEVDDALPGLFLRVVPQAGAARRDAALRRHAGHLGVHQPGAAGRARAVVNQMPVTWHAVLRPNTCPSARRPRGFPASCHAGAAAGTSAPSDGRRRSTPSCVRASLAKCRSAAATNSGARSRRLS